MSNTSVKNEEIKTELTAEPEDPKCMDCGKEATVLIEYHSTFKMDGKGNRRDFERTICCGCYQQYTEMFMFDYHQTSGKATVAFKTIGRH